METIGKVFARAEKAEARVKELEEFSNFAISYLIERVNQLLEKTGEQGSDSESWLTELKRLHLLSTKGGQR